MMIKVNKTVSPSIKKNLVNERKFAPELDIADLPCTCRDVAGILGVELKDDDHICNLITSTNIGKEVAYMVGKVEVNFDSNVVPNFNSFYRESKVNVNKCMKNLRMYVDHELLFFPF